MQVSNKGTEKRFAILLGIVCLVLELALAPNIAIANGHPNFLLIFAAVVAMGHGGREGVIVGFVAGLLFDLSATSPLGLMAFELTVASYVLGLGTRNRFAEEPSSSLTSFIATDLAVCALYSIAMLMLGESSSLVNCLFLRALPTAFLSFLAFLPFWWAMTRSVSGMSFSKDGGAFLAGGKRSKHLDTKGL